MIFKQITYLRKDDRLQHIMQEKKRFLNRAVYN